MKGISFPLMRSGKLIPSLLLDIDPLFVGGVFGMNFENFRKKPHGVKKCLHLGAKICDYELLKSKKLD